MLMRLWCIDRGNYTHGALGRLVTNPFLRHPLMIHPLKTPPSLFYHKNRSTGSRSHQRHRQRSNRRHQTKIRPSITRTTCGASLLFFTPLKPIHCSFLLSTHPFDTFLPYLIILSTHPIHTSYCYIRFVYQQAIRTFFNPLLPYLILPLPTHPINISY